MIESATVRPTAGRRVRHPETMVPLGEEWVRLPRDQWLLRRLADGDLEEKPVASSTTPAPRARKEG
jgi:hypothetical protein